MKAFMVVGALALFALLTYNWQSCVFNDPAGELFNKQEWSVVQSASEDFATALPNEKYPSTTSISLGDERFFLIGLLAEDGKSLVWLLANSKGIPRLKVSKTVAPLPISQADFDRLVSATKPNDDVRVYLLALVRR